MPRSPFEWRPGRVRSWSAGVDISIVGRANATQRIVFALLDPVKRREREGGGREERENVQSNRLGRVRRSPWQNVAGNIRESHLHRCSLPEEGYPVTSTSITAKFNGKVFGLATSRY